MTSKNYWPKCQTGNLLLGMSNRSFPRTYSFPVLVIPASPWPESHVFRIVGGVSISKIFQDSKGVGNDQVEGWQDPPSSSFRQVVGRNLFCSGLETEMPANYQQA